MIAAKKLAFADRAKNYADRDFAKIPIGGLISKKCAGAGLLRALTLKGYDVGGYGGHIKVEIDDSQRVYVGASESRKDGEAAGY